MVVGVVAVVGVSGAAVDMVVVNDLSSKFQEIKTKALVEKLAALGVDVNTQKTLLILNEACEAVIMSGRNIEFLSINTSNAVQVYDVLNADRIVIEEAALAYINEYYGASSPSESE